MADETDDTPKPQPSKTSGDTPGDTPGDTGDSAQAAAPNEAEGPQIRVLAQYIRDLSFENPDPIAALQAGQPAPAIELGIDVQARRAPANEAYEIDLNINVRAQRENAVAFLCELKYAGLFQFVNVPPEAIEPLLLVEAPRMLFPFARRIVAEATRDGGFPPLYIDPIDFMGLYQKQRAEGGAPAAAAEGAAGNA